MPKLKNIIKVPIFWEGHKIWKYSWKKDVDERSLCFINYNKDKVKVGEIGFVVQVSKF